MNPTTPPDSPTRKDLNFTRSGASEDTQGLHGSFNREAGGQGRGGLNNFDGLHERNKVKSDFESKKRRDRPQGGKKR